MLTSFKWFAHIAVSSKLQPLNIQVLLSFKNSSATCLLKQTEQIEDNTIKATSST